MGRAWCARGSGGRSGRGRPGRGRWVGVGLVGVGSRASARAVGVSWTPLLLT
jgi:hypothetical protein